jgi:hypothetical protein
VAALNEIKEEVVNLNIHEGISVAPDLLANLKIRVGRYIVSMSAQHEGRLKKQSADAIVEKVRDASVLLPLQRFAARRPAMWMAKLNGSLLPCYAPCTCVEH